MLFFRTSAKIVKEGATLYIKGAAYGAGAGAFVGGAAAFFTSPLTFALGVEGSKAKTIPGKLVDGLEETGKVGLAAVRTGIALGGFPVTYPLMKAYKKWEEHNQQSNSEPRSPKI